MAALKLFWRHSAMNRQMILRFWVALPMGLLLLLSGGSAYSGPAKISPNLQKVISVSSDLFPRDLEAPKEPGPETRVIIQALCTDSQLIHAGLQLSSRIGDVITGTINVTRIPALASLSCVQFMEAPAPVRVYMDKSYPAIQGNQFRSGGAGSYLGLTGRDVLIGIIDTGVDFSHSDLRDAEGARILWLWDQTVDLAPPTSFTYGNECSKAQIDAGSCTQVDLRGHGTHVAGVAAGNGVGTGNGFPSERYVSAAPEAGLIVVKASNSGIFESDRLIDAISYITQRAKELGKPLVVNLSLGTQFGPHDGTSLLSRAVDLASGPGRIFVVSAGNDGNNAPDTHPQPHLHAMGTLPDTVTIHLPSCRNEGANNDILAIDIWYSGKMCMEIVLTSPNGYVHRASTGETNDEFLRWTDDGYVYINNAVGGTNPNNFDHEALVQIFDFFDKNASGERVPAPGTWTLELQKTCNAQDETYHLWIFDNQFCREDFGITSSNRSNTHLVASPGDALRAISVGAFTARNQWTDVSGRTITEPDILGGLAFFSSPGPTRDGRVKPDLNAPGNLVISTLSEKAAFEYPVERIAEDGVHALVKGTSFSAPHITAAVAVLLQIDSEMDPSLARSLLIGSAESDVFTGIVPNSAWGFGKVNILETLRMSPPPGPAITRISRISATTAEIYWGEPMVPATYILLDRKEEDNGGWVRVAALPGSERSFRDEGLTGGSVYLYRVAAVFNQLESTFSTEQPVSSEGSSSGGGGGGCFIQTLTTH